MRPTRVIKCHFTDYEREVYFGDRKPDEIRQIAEMLQRSSYDERRLFRQRLAEALGAKNDTITNRPA